MPEGLDEFSNLFAKKYGGAGNSAIRTEDETADLGGFFSSKYGAPAEPEKPAIPNEQGGFIASAKRAAGAGIKGAGQAAADFIPGVGQDNALKRAGQGIIDANPTAVNSLEDIADKPGTAVAEATGNAASSMAGIVGARAVGQGITALSPLAGPAAPLVAAAGQVVSWLGPAAIAALPSFGGIRDKQILADPDNQDSAKSKAVAALGAATVGAIESRFGPQNWALAAMTKEGRAKLAEKFAATTLKGSIGKGIVKGAAIEGAEELVQNPVEQLASFENPTTPENIDETLFGGAMGAIGGGVLGGGTGAVFRRQENAEHVKTILGKPVTEVSDGVLKYTSNRGGERAKAAAQTELNRRATEGVDPSVADAPESASEAVDRIISTGRDKADEIRETRQAASDAIQDGVFDEPSHVNDAINMVDAPTPERIETLNAQMDALAEGRKPGVLLTPGEPMPHSLPEGVQAAEIPGRGTLLYRDDATLQAALDNRMGEALGYGIDEKPGTDQVVTARDANGTVIQDVATDGRPEVEQAAAGVAGEHGSVEVRPVGEAMAERAANSREFDGIKTQADVVIPTSNKNQSVTTDTGIPVTQAIGPARETRPTQQPSIEDKSREAQSPAGNESVSEEAGAVQPAKKALKPKKKEIRANLEDHFRPGNIIRNSYWRNHERVLSFNQSDNNWSVTVQTVKKDAAGNWVNTEAPRTHRTFPSFDKDIVVERHPVIHPEPGSADSSSEINAQESHPIRAHLESLIKRRAPAKQGGKDLSKAIERAKEVMEGKREASTVEHRYFRLHAKAFEKADMESAKILRKIAEAVKPKALETQAASSSFERFAALGHEIGTAKQALADAEEITGLRLGLQIAYVKLRAGNPARFVPESRTLEVSRDWKYPRSEGAQYLAEELFHAVDVLSGDRTLSASSKRLDLKTGDIAQEVISHYDDKSAYTEFLSYPLGDNSLSDSVKKAELFARLAVLYFGEPARMQRYLPTAYGAFNEIFRFSINPVTGEISRSLWSFAGGRPPLGSEHGASGQDVSGNGGISQSGQRAELGRLRKSIWRVFKADPLGGKVSFSRVDTRSFKSRLQAYKEKSARKSESPKFSRDAAQIAETRNRLKAASAKSKQAAKQGGLSVSDVKKFIEPLQQAGFKKINIAATQNDLPQKIKEQIKSQKAGGVRGVYLPTTDEIWLVADQLNDAFEVAMVTMHEARHRGLRKMFGADVDPIMRQIYATNKRVRDAADRMMKAHAGMSKETAVEEVLADMSIDRVRALNGWKKLVRFIQQWISEKFDITFTDAMVEQLVAGAEVVGMAENEVSLFDEKQAEVYRDASDGTMFSRMPPQPGGNASWDAPEPSKLDNLIYSLQNKHIDMKRVMESVRESGQQLAEKFDAYLQEELFHGRSAKRTKDFVNSELKPLIAGLKLRGLSIDELDKYLHARHAQEANALIAQRDPNMPDGGSGMTNQEARDYFANLPADKKRKLEQTAKKVDDIISQTRDLYVSYGLISQAEADSWAQMFKFYVPLMREDKDGGMGIGQGFSIKGKEAKHRTGSKRAVVDILANIALQRERAIVRGEKNRVAVSLYGLAKLNPNDEFWTTENVPQRHYDEKTGQVVERADPRYKERANVVVSKIVDSKGRVTERAVIFNENDERAMRMAQAIKNLDASQLEGLMGVSAKVTRYFAAINTQYNPVFGIVNLTRDLQASLLNLSSTPIAGHKAAVLGNILPAIRAIYASSRGERKGNQSTSTMAALWDEMQKEGGMTGYRDLFKTSEDRANAIKRELDPTAWMNSGLGKIFTAGGALKVPLAIAQKRAGWLFDWLSDYNQTLEGAMRLSVYKVAIDKGLSKARAASIAKNISVNFNRKGSSGQQAGALYAFFNAAMQGTARIGETMTTMEKGDIKTFRFNKAGKQIIAGGITLGAVQALALAAAGFDDDEPPEFVRERSLIIPIGDKKYVTIPMPLGFHAIPNIGRISTEFAMGGFKKPADHTMRLAAVFAEAFNPIGSAGFSIQTIAPTAIDSLVALSENKDWTGKPIAKEDFNKLSPTPGFSRNKNTASDPAKWIAEAINTISGGNKYVPGVFSPTADQIDYLAGQVTGGVGRESGKAQQSVAAVLTGEDLPPHKIPLVGRFYGNSENSSSQGNAFYSNLKRINELEAELKGRRKDRLPIDEFKAENPEHRLVVRANLIERLVSKQRKMKSELIEKDAPNEQVKAVEERITKLMTGFNVRVKELRQEARQ
ncbi:hypothetical protein SAMN05216428_102398 [Nitrosospira sp. Nsp11]|uniref:LPD38 domain-containing protein n=1 Tax=Nitrosospira sp. Nsp11 TaxID=1855338 RepID=UPI0009169A4D|nr:LPD38 domain-containing protein [Nitrosospira sp. Nsp11]SHL43508.1 hypothetical protein SAMN05216428_102398 [Nitrosospira sp. Nsp11]